MTGFIYFVSGEKKLLLCNDMRELQGKFNLTKMGLDEVDSVEDFLKLFPACCYYLNREF